MNKKMIMIEDSSCLYVIQKLDNGNYKIESYMQDDNDFGQGSKIWWKTERTPNGLPLEKKHTMEPQETYNDLIELARKVIKKYEETV